MKRDAQGQHNKVAVHCSTGETDRLKRKWRLSGRVTSRRQKGENKESKGVKRSEDMGATQNTLRLIYCGLFHGSITEGCLTSKLTEIMIDIMYVLSTKPNILLRDCS